MRVVLCFSGGIASTALLWKLLNDGHNVEALFFDWGHPSRPGELAAAMSLAGQAKRTKLLRLSMPEFCHLWDGDWKRSTEARRLAFLSIAAIHAARREADQVAWAEHGLPMKGVQGEDDHTRPFFNHLTVAAGHVLQHELGFYCPWWRWQSAEILDLAGKLGVPLESTWSCLGPNIWQCGECTGCTRRRRAFATLGMRDPTVYGEQPDVLEFRKIDDDDAA
jgi:7-cyano-7-deazaguanine synthase